MAEPAGILLEINIDKKEVKKFLNHTNNETPFGKKNGYYFSKLLYESNIDSKSVFIFNYDKNTNSLFIAWVLNHYQFGDIVPFIGILKQISELKSSTTKDFAIVTTTFPEIIESYKIDKNLVKKIKPEQTPLEIVTKLTNKFWSFATNNQFPDVSIALNKRNYFYKNFKSYYKKYLKYIAEIEKPTKISQATKEHPLHLFDKIYTYNNKVFEFRTFTDQVIEIPNADPLTFRNVSGIYADKNHVYLNRLTPNSPKNINPKTGGNNPNAIWEYFIVDNVDGKSFNYVKEKYDTIYWKDINSVFIYDKIKRNLIKVVNADIKTFKYLSHIYGKDKNTIFCLEKPININSENFIIGKYGFIYDDCNVYHFENKLPLDGKTFKVINTKKTKQWLYPDFYLEDKNGTYIYNRNWEGIKIKKI